MKKTLLLALVIGVCSVATVMGAGAQESAATDDGPIEISLGFDVQTMDDPMAEYIFEKFNMKINVVALEDEALKVMAATGDLPDAFSTWPGIGDPLFNALIRDEQVRDIPASILNKYPELKIYTESVPEVTTHRDMMGKLYMIPRRGASHVDSYVVGHGVYYRKDWADKLRIDAPTTMDELYEMLRAFTYDDPDGNGVDDTIGMTGWLWQIHYIQWVDIYNWIEEDGKWIPGYVSDNVIPALQFWNKAYKDGVLDPEFASTSNRKNFYADKNGVLYGKSDPYWTWRQLIREYGGAHPEVAPLDIIKYAPPLRKDISSPPRWPAADQRQATLFNIKVDDTKLNRIFQFFEWALSDEGRDFANYGFVGQDYEIKDGLAVSKLPWKDEANKVRRPIFEQYPSVSLFGWLAWGITPVTRAKNALIPEEIEDMVNYFQTDLYGPAAVPFNVAVNSIVTPAKEKWNTSEEDAEEQFIAMIASDDPVQQFIDYRNKLMEMGLKEVIDEVNQAVRDLGIE